MESDNLGHIDMLWFYTEFFPVSEHPIHLRSERYCITRAILLDDYDHRAERATITNSLIEC